MDDGAFYQYAHHISQHPADPYGFEVFWHDQPEPANRVLAPPVLLYWWAAAQALFGESPLAWKLWLFPFALLLCLSLDRLLRRVAPEGRVPLLCLVLPTRKRPPEVPVLVG